MKSYRVLMMLAGLLAMVSAAHAQTPPPVLPQTYSPNQPKRVVIALPGTDTPATLEAELTESLRCEAAWPVQAWQHMVTAWQRARSVCAANAQKEVCCEASAKAARCALGIAGSVKGSEIAQAPKACACAKTCACCESCKATKDTSARTQPQPMTAEMRLRIAGLHGIAPPPPPWPVIGLPPCLPPAQGAGIVQVMPVPGMRIIHVMQEAHMVKPVHFVTPEIDAHCERMHHHGDMVVLEGNVLLLCKKHAQPIRIEAQRVIVNMKDGSFRVDSNAGPMPTSSFGVQRTSAVNDATQYRTTVGSGIRVVVPMMGPVPATCDVPTTLRMIPAPVANPVPTRGTDCPLEGLLRRMLSPAPSAERLFLREIEPIPGR